MGCCLVDLSTDRIVDWAFAVQIRGALFNLDPGSTNVLAGREQPLHKIISAFAGEQDIRIAHGIMGGWNQSQAHAQFVANVVDFRRNIQAAWMRHVS